MRKYKEKTDLYQQRWGKNRIIFFSENDMLIHWENCMFSISRCRAIQEDIWQRDVRTQLKRGKKEVF